MVKHIISIIDHDFLVWWNLNFLDIKVLYMWFNLYLTRMKNHISPWTFTFEAILLTLFSLLTFIMMCLFKFVVLFCVVYNSVVFIPNSYENVTMYRFVWFRCDRRIFTLSQTSFYMKYFCISQMLPFISEFYTFLFSLFL